MAHRLGKRWATVVVVATRTTRWVLLPWQATTTPRWNNVRSFSYSTASSSPSSSSSSQNRTFPNTKERPFYGEPRPPREGRSVTNRIAVALHAATTAFGDPTRADAVAALGEVTGEVTLRRILERMTNDDTGRIILQERPIVSKATIPYERLITEAPDHLTEDSTFGHAYGSFLRSHGFDPDERDQVKYIDDEDLAYVMLRYRQVRKKMEKICVDFKSFYRLG